MGPLLKDSDIATSIIYLKPLAMATLLQWRIIKKVTNIRLGGVVVGGHFVWEECSA